MKNLTMLFAVTVVCLIPDSYAQTGALYEVALEDRIRDSEVVVEGRVVEKESFWNADLTRIYTANVVEVYRLFKGAVKQEVVYVVTPGGVVGWKAQTVSPSLALGIGDTGLFFLSPTPAVAALAKYESVVALEPHASVQGFVRYDVATGSAADVFHTYRDIESELFEPLMRDLGEPVTVRDFKMAPPVASKTGQIPVITSFTPSPITAGTGSVLTINGTGFEAYGGDGGNSTVFFPNADNGGSGTTPATPHSEIVSWSDSKIEVKVPTGSGTGAFTVRSNSGMQGSSATALSVDYNLVNVAFEGFKRTILRNKDNGGYSLVMSTNNSSQGVDFATSDAVDPFNRALATWQTTTGFNVRNDGGLTTENTVAPNSDPDIVMFDNEDNPLPNGVLGRAYSGFTSSNGTDWFVAGMDIQFRRDGSNVTWNYGPASTSFCCYDFESVALHELGHAHQLGHIIDPGAVMNYNISNGSDSRDLDAASDIAGGNDVLDYAASKAGGMSRLMGVGVEDEPAARTRGLHVDAAFPNPAGTSSIFSVEVDRAREIRVDVFDVLGRRVLPVFDGVASNRHVFAVDLKELPAGVYFYRVMSDTETYSRSLIVQR